MLKEQLQRKTVDVYLAHRTNNINKFTLILRVRVYNSKYSSLSHFLFHKAVCDTAQLLYRCTTHGNSSAPS